MFVARNQIFVFIACLAIGGVGGVFFTLSAFIKFFIKNRILKIIPDVVAFIVFSAIYVALAYFLAFPSFRLYMAFGAVLGLYAYMKSFNNILAFHAEKLYNITVRKIVARKKALKASVKENVGRNEKRKRCRKRGVGKTRKRIGRAI